MSQFPKTDVIYRIRNVDSRLYLERSAIPSAPSVPQMRSEDTTSKRQHWRVTRPNNPPEGEYRIVDPNNVQLPALCFNPPNNANPVVVGRALNNGLQHNYWNIVPNAANSIDKAFYLTSVDPNGGQGVVLGNNIPNNTTPFVGFQTAPAQPPAANGGPAVQIAAANFQWQLYEVSPADIPDEVNSKYRIRAFLGKPLQVDASGNLNLDPSDARGDQRVWTITDKGNGRCTVYSDRAQQFLTARNVSTTPGTFDWRPVLRAATEPSFPDADKLWIFEKTTSLTHTIFLERPAALAADGTTPVLRQFALALDGINAILKPKKLAHNEVWLVEPIDTPMPGDSTGTGPNVTTGVTPVVGFPPGLASNETYRFRNPEWPNNTTPSFILHNVTSWSGPTYSFTSANSTAPAGLRVETKSTGGVALYTLVGAQRWYLNWSGTSIVSTALSVPDNATGWTVTRISLTDSGGRYTIAVNGRLLSTATGNTLNLTDAQNPPAASQIWAISV